MAERKEGAGRTALITGASSGIGLELSRKARKSDHSVEVCETPASFDHTIARPRVVRLGLASG